MAKSDLERVVGTLRMIAVKSEDGEWCLDGEAKFDTSERFNSKCDSELHFHFSVSCMYCPGKEGS